MFPILNAGADCDAAGGITRRPDACTSDALAARTPDPFLQWETRAGMAELHFAKGDLAGARSETEQALQIVDGSWSRLVERPVQADVSEPAGQFLARPMSIS